MSQKPVIPATTVCRLVSRRKAMASRFILYKKLKICYTYICEEVFYYFLLSSNHKTKTCLRNY